MRYTAIVVAVLFLTSFGNSDTHASPSKTARSEASEKTKPSDKQIKHILIKKSIAAYSGNCPCPYSRARNGSKCGKRSAWSRPGGEAPLCFETDVTEEMVAAYRAKHL